ncbi:MAG: sigma-54 dependent transcriptional regulator, partial [Candidatus Riflebacteria bacterium]|nr:sigma-54 dependent transcriptional regulator [Candidatus Riflebacteria bacterium]
AVNFDLPLPPEMKRKILYDIGLKDETVPEINHKYLPYLRVMKKMVDLIGKNNEIPNRQELANTIWKEGRKLRLFENEIQQLVNVFPEWLEKISKRQTLEIAPAKLQEVESSYDACPELNGIIGKSNSMQSIFACLKKISKSNLSVLIRGESGTGKELVANAIHSLSDRNQHNFIPVNCGALPETIIESELFGHEKGSFTGAENLKKGYFETANKGTVFLDEITETSLTTQVKLLRVLQEKQFFRVGGTAPVKSDCRIIAATNADIVESVKNGTFRHDLFYRINEMTVYLPPLRERISDLPLLVKNFLAVFAKQNNKKIPIISNETWKIFENYRWPGNIRELENVIKRAVVLADGIIEPEHLPSELTIFNFDEQTNYSNKSDNNETLAQLVAKAEKKIILAKLAENNNNMTKTASILGVSRRTLQRKLKS